MRILVFSDTHGNYSDPVHIINNIKDVDAVIHCGDIISDCREIQRVYPKLPFYYVCGNNDISMDVPRELSIELAGKKIFITHGHLYKVRITDALLRKKIEEGYDLVVYGHTHVPDTEYYNSGIILNPGAMCYGNKTYAVIEIENNKLKTAILNS